MITQAIATPVGHIAAMWTEQGKLYSCEFASAGRSPSELSQQPYRDAGSHPHSPMHLEHHGPQRQVPVQQHVPLQQLLVQQQLLAERQQLLAERLDEYFCSGRLSWELSALDWRGITPFHREVLERCAQILAGQTLTYGQLAARAGRPRAARAVGSAMARNRWPLIIPCHRVVGSDGRLTGYSGNGGIETKRRLLGLEAGESVA